MSTTIDWTPPPAAKKASRDPANVFSPEGERQHLRAINGRLCYRLNRIRDYAKQLRNTDITVTTKDLGDYILELAGQ